MTKCHYWPQITVVDKCVADLASVNVGGDVRIAGGRQDIRYSWQQIWLMRLPI